MTGAFINGSFNRPEDRAMADPVEFSEYGADVLDSERLTDLTYRVFLMMMAKRYMSGQAGCLEPLDADLAHLIVHGLYVPCVRRVTYTRHVDQYVDGLPDYAAVFHVDPGGTDCSIQQMRRVERFPRRVAGVAPGVRYKYVCWHRDELLCRKERRYNGENDVLSAYDSYATVTPDDRVVHAQLMLPRRVYSAQQNAIRTVWPTLVLNAWSDRRYLWQVRTTDHVIDSLATPLTLGVAEEHVKSLFYARSLPVTESGRKRPILHWVRAHARRMREGTDIDVRRHLRGITEFEMDGLRFAIVSPDKNDADA